MVTARFERPYVARFSAENGSKLMQNPRPVVGVNHDLHWQRIASAACPLDIDFTLRFIHQTLDIWASLGMHRNALAASNITDNSFTANGITAFGPVDKNIVSAFHMDGQVSIAERRRRLHRRGSQQDWFCCRLRLHIIRRYSLEQLTGREL